MKNCGLDSSSVSFPQGSAGYLISKVCRSGDKGVRTLEKTIKDLVNKINFIEIHQNETGILPFKTSFQLNYKLTFPIVLKTELLDKLLEDSDLEVTMSMMYI